MEISEVFIQSKQSAPYLADSWRANARVAWGYVLDPAEFPISMPLVKARARKLMVLRHTPTQSRCLATPSHRFNNTDPFRAV
jgi:hypothetical protein